MKATSTTPLFILLLLFAIPSSTSLAGPRASIVANMPSPPAPALARGQLTSLRVSGGGGQEPAGELKDYSSEMSALFGNIRVPAALFAGASAGAAFALPLAQSEGLRVGLVKRIYSLLMMSALSCQLLAIIVSTLAMGSIAVSAQSRKADSMSAFIDEYFDLSWATARFNFFGGILCFVIGSGLRAWISISCPIFARAALGIITSSSLLAVAFIEDNDKKIRGVGQGILGLTAKYIKLLVKKATEDPLFGLGSLSMALTWGYIVYNIPHVWEYLAKV